MNTTRNLSDSRVHGQGLLGYDDDDHIKSDTTDSEIDDSEENNGDYLLVKLMAKHNQLISRKWLIASIIVQIFILGFTVPVFFQATLYHFTDYSGELTPLFFWPEEEIITNQDKYYHNFNHSGRRIWWFSFNDVYDCIRYNVVSRRTCDTL